MEDSKQYISVSMPNGYRGKELVNIHVSNHKHGHPFIHTFTDKKISEESFVVQVVSREQAHTIIRNDDESLLVIKDVIDDNLL